MASGGSDQDAEYALFKLFQFDTIEDYQREFEKLMNRVTDILESLLISYFLSRLKLNLQHAFFVSRPTTLGDAFSLAYIIEARFEDEWTVTTIANPNIAVPDEVLEESTLHTSDMVEVVPTCMVATYDEHEESGDGEQDDAMESGDISILNSLVGQGSPRSLQLWGTLGSGRVHILINNERTYTFVQPGVVKRMHLPITESMWLDQGKVLEGLQHEQGLLLFRSRYFIGARSKLKEVLLSEFHDTPSAGHGDSKKKIRDEIQRRTWDPKIKKFFLGITLRARWL
ncbi:hypothetical protein Tco_0221454 [Tanacetum coccineum]